MGSAMAVVVASWTVLAPAPVQAGAAAALVGSWRLVANQEHQPDGRVTDVWGSDPLGRLVYDARGRMSVQLLSRHRRSFAGNDRAAGTPEETREAFVGFLAYFGTYTVDEKAGTVVHHVEGASFPNLMGSHQRRTFVLSGNRLTLSTPPILANRRTSKYVLVWEREE
jgi:hypothetical protein